MQIAKTMLEKYVYNEIASVFRKKVNYNSLSNAQEDIDCVYNNLKSVDIEISEEVVENKVLEYLNESVLWIEDSSNAGMWTKTDIIDILTYIEKNRAFVTNSMMEDLVTIIDSIGNSKTVE